MCITHSSHPFLKKNFARKENVVDCASTKKDETTRQKQHQSADAFQTFLFTCTRFRSTTKTIFGFYYTFALIFFGKSEHARARIKKKTAHTDGEYTTCH